MKLIVSHYTDVKTEAQGGEIAYFVTSTDKNRP